MFPILLNLWETYFFGQKKARRTNPSSYREAKTTSRGVVEALARPFYGAVARVNSATYLFYGHGTTLGASFISFFTVRSQRNLFEFNMIFNKSNFCPYKWGNFTCQLGSFTSDTFIKRGKNSTLHCSFSGTVHLVYKTSSKMLTARLVNSGWILALKFKSLRFFVYIFFFSERKSTWFAAIKYLFPGNFAGRNTFIKNLMNFFCMQPMLWVLSGF